MTITIEIILFIFQIVANVFVYGLLRVLSN
jgi:hypothetical protein